jgi:phosphate uptake regulator
MFRDIFHKLKIFFCDDDVEKIYIRDSTVIRNNEIHKMYDEILDELGDLATVVSRNYVYGRIKDRTGLSIRHISRIINHTKDVMERNVINEISTLFVMIFTSGLMFVMPILDVGYNDIIVIIGFGILLSFMLTIIPILLSYDIRDEIIELIEDMDSQIVVDTSVYKTNLP